MQDYQITEDKLDEHVEKISVGLKPEFEPKLERVHVCDFYDALVEEFPGIFETLIHSPTECQIRKTFVFPGKMDIESVILICQRGGMDFVIPRRFALVQENTALEDTQEIAAGCIKLIRKHFPTKRIYGLGHINEYIFGLEEHNGPEFIASRFTKITVQGQDEEISVRVNRPDNDYNKIIDLKPVVEFQAGQEGVTRWGMKVSVDFNNRDTTRDLTLDDVRLIIEKSGQFNRDELYAFLNATETWQG
ncbi:MAG TPA: hypothetical protein VMW23_04015 [Sedimentisphaerales bacterium]|nr:hypothetical protein [Sedimentisphaerales bacterium]